MNSGNSIDELAEAIKNSLERGASLEEIKSSFINAGYNFQDIEKAVQEIQIPVQLQAPLAQAPEKLILKPVKLEPRPVLESAKEYPLEIQQKQSKSWIIISVIASILILVGSTLLGLYWDSIF